MHLCTIMFMDINITELLMELISLLFNKTLFLGHKSPRDQPTCKLFIALLFYYCYAMCVCEAIS